MLIFLVQETPGDVHNGLVTPTFLLVKSNDKLARRTENVITVVLN